MLLGENGAVLLAQVLGHLDVPIGGRGVIDVEAPVLRVAGIESERQQPALVEVRAHEVELQLVRDVEEGLAEGGSALDDADRALALDDEEKLLAVLARSGRGVDGFVEVCTADLIEHDLVAAPVPDRRRLRLTTLG